jgi:hypothetical protein
MTLDGVFNETVWGEATPVAIPAASCNYGTGCGAVDLTASASYRTVWTPSGLWIGITVSDPGTLYADTAAPWNGSGVEIFFDLNNARGGYNAGTGDYNDANTYQWAITYNSATVLEYRNATARTILAASKATAGVGYTMELEIPWANLGVSAPSAGALSGLDVAVDVANTAGTARDHGIVAYNGSFNPFDQTPAQWGGVQYDACNSYTATNTPVVTATPTYTKTATPLPTNTFTSVPTNTFTPAATATFTTAPTNTPVSRGASEPYTEYEAEAGSWGSGATLLGSSRSIFTTGGSLSTEKQAEASGRQAVELAGTNQYVQWTTTAPCNSIVVRLSVPDGFSGTIGVFIGGASSPQIELPVTAKYSWEYDNWNIPYSESGSKPFHIYDEAHALLGVEVPAGTVVKLMKTSADTAAYYTIDLVDLEEVGAALAQPANSLNAVTNYGASGNGSNDDTTALQNCINAAQTQGKIAFIPAGVYKISSPLSVPAVTVQGAGMWRTTIHQVNDTSVIRFNLNNASAMVADLLLTGEVTNRNDGNTDSGFDYHGGTNSLVQRVWIEHTKCGWWCGNTNSVTSGLTVTGCRIRDTYADGINLCNGSSSCTITQCNFRNTGDDSIASWSPSGGGNNNANTFTWNTVQCTWRADAIAVYGGSNFTITDNLCSDTLDQSGIMVQQGFTSNGFGGTNNILRNTLTRCGGYFSGNYGAIDFWANQGAINGNWNVTSLDIESPSFEGFEYDGCNAVNGVTVGTSVCNNAGSYGVQVTGCTGGTTTFNSTNMNGSGSGAYAAGGMTVNRNSCNW